MEADARDQRIRELEALVERLEALVAQQADEIKRLRKRIEELEGIAVRQAAPFRRPEKKRKPKDRRKPPGRPPGHQASYRVRPPQIDEQFVVPLPACPICGGQLQPSSIQPCVQYVEDLPPLGPQVTKLTTHVGRCPRCGPVRSTHPLQVSTAQGAAGTHLGPRALALAAELNKGLGLTMRTTCRVLKRLGGLSLTPGGLAQAMHRVAHRAVELAEDLQACVRQAPVVYADETSWWIDGEQAWLWTFTSPETTVYRLERGRGREVVEGLLGRQFEGVLVSDCLAAYERLPYRQHKCYAHHLKAISLGLEKKPESELLAELQGMLKAAMMLKRIRHDIPPPAWHRARAHLESQAETLLRPGGGDPVEQRVVNRLRRRRQWLFTFLDHEEVEATNNRAERSLRPAVIARKVSCGNKTAQGARTWEILTSLAVTFRQRGEDLVQQLAPVLRVTTSAEAR
ncbi:MAG: IS66 family transposase [Planctomycetota bacterium]|jgi:hypothetical protein